jgi:excisionase family DNA binding protein
MPDTATRYLSKREVAEILGVHTDTIEAYIRDHGLPAVRLGSWTIRIDAAVLESWLREREVGAQP